MNERKKHMTYRRKSFCAPTKKAVLKKIGDYIEAFKREVAEADETKKPLRKSMQKWLDVFQYGTVERATHDRKEDCAKRYIYPRIGDLIISEVAADDLSGILSQMMIEGYAHSTVKFKDAVTELNCLNECEGFINGFRLGIRLMVEALHTEE